MLRPNYNIFQKFLFEDWYNYVIKFTITSSFLVKPRLKALEEPPVFPGGEKPEGEIPREKLKRTFLT